jgi:hypothetical protein
MLSRASPSTGLKREQDLIILNKPSLSHELDKVAYFSSIKSTRLMGRSKYLEPAIAQLAQLKGGSKVKERTLYIGPPDRPSGA